MTTMLRVVLGHAAWLAALAVGVAVPASAQSTPEETPQSKLPVFWKNRLQDVDASVRRVKKGTSKVLVRSPGGRRIYLVAYGERDHQGSTANYNSAVGGGDPASYARKDGTQKPVVLLLGPVHSQEVEGIVGLLNLIEVAETGRDLRGRAWPELAGNLARCRTLIVPCGNPDGRARCPMDSWVGLDLSVHETPCGARPPYIQVSHEQILDLEMLLYDELFRYAVENRVNWKP
jgi:hypothetical protein